LLPLQRDFTFYSSPETADVTCHRPTQPKSTTVTVTSDKSPTSKSCNDKTEETRIKCKQKYHQAITGDVIEQITHFASGSPERELHLPPSLTAYNRLLVHETAERLGLKHTTVGTEKNRHIVLKRK